MNHLLKTYYGKRYSLQDANGLVLGKDSKTDFFLIR